MTKPLPWTGRVALFLFLPAGILPFVYSSDQHSRINRALPNDPSGPTARVPAAPGTPIEVEQRSPKIVDWSTRHTMYTQFGTSRALELAQRDPRARFRWQEVEQRLQANRVASRPRANLQFGLRNFPQRFPQRLPASGIQADWNISLGNGATGPSQFPAKYSFNVNAAPDCTNDFIVYPVNATPSTTQPNIVGFNMLYSGTAGTTGICNSRPILGTISTPVLNTDNAGSAVVYFSYSVRSIAGAVATSPTLSLDGKKIAFVETGGNSAHFHVLAWKAQDGIATTGGGTLGTGQNRQDVTLPKSITSFAATAPAAGSGTATDLSFGAANDTNSSPYIDYSNDTAYVANDKGVLFRIKNVFCTLPTCGTALPSLDTTFGTSGSVTVCSGKVATGPTQDFFTGNVYVGCSDGKLYGYNSAGTALPNSPVAIGNGSGFGDVADAPIVDSLNQFVYSFSGAGAATPANSVLVQLHTDLSSPRIAFVGNGAFQSIHAPAFNDAYFTSATSTNWFIVSAGYDSTNSNLTFYKVTFDTNRNMNAGAAAAQDTNIGTRLGEYTPLTEFVNSGNDYIFFGLLIGPANWGRQTITTFSTSAVPTTPGTSLPNSSTGVTPMIVDNNSAQNQASSIYFTSVGQNVALKYTQINLN
jgi:hypothetical protein